MDDDWEKYKNFALQFESQNNFAMAEGIWAMCVLMGEAFDPADPRLAFSLDRLGHALLKQRKLKLAERFLTRSWNIKGGNPTQNGLELASTANLLAELYFHEQRWVHAESLCQWVVDLYVRTYGEGHQTTQTAQRNLQLVRGAIPKTEEIPQPVVQQAQVASAAQASPMRPINRKLLKPVCERCGQPIEGDECLRCTGTNVRAISPLDKLT